LTSSIIIGSVPAVVVGSLLSSRANGIALRRIITATVLLSGLKYVGVPIGALGVAAVILAAGIIALEVKQAGERRRLEVIAASVTESV
jgi:hypothetical protein